MGTEFLNKNKGAIRKCREKQKAKLQNELTPYVEEVPVVAMKLLCEPRFADKQKFEVRVENNNLKLYQDRSLIGFAPNANSNLVSRVKEAGGRVLGAVDRLRRHSNLLDVSLTIPRERGIYEKQ